MMVFAALIAVIHILKMTRLKNWCHEKDCKNFQILDWQGEFIEKYWCKKHKKKEKKKQ